MLLQVTTYRIELFCRVMSDLTEAVKIFTLPPGKYFLRRIKHPLHDDLDDWLILDGSCLAKLKLESHEIIGISYQAIKFRQNISHQIEYPSFPDMKLSVEEVSPMTMEEVSVSAEVSEVVRARSPVVPPTPCIIHPRLIRHDRAGRHTTGTTVNHDRRRKLHPAARRAC